MKYVFDNLKNNFDFFLRNKFNFSRRNYSQNHCLIDVLRNLYFFNVFNKCLTYKNEKISILDIGSKNWEYVKSEYYFFNMFAKDFIIRGIELDAFRLNSAFYSRYEIAKFHIQDLPNAQYIADDFLKHNQKYDYIIWILPFITKYPLVKWGLPLKYFKPLEMLKHAYELLNNNGELLIINQGEKEYLIQKELIEKLGLKAQCFGQIEDRFNLFQNKRYCNKIIKQ